MTLALKPPFTYYGGKTRIAPFIVERLPAHLHYVEPFAGSLAVLLAKHPSRLETVNDLDGELMAFWRVLRDRPDELMRVCALTPHSRTESVSIARDRDGLDDLELARRVWVMVSQSFGGTLRRTQHGWKQFVSGRHGMSMPDYLDVFVERMSPVARRIHRVTLESRPGIEIVDIYGRCPDVCMYVDPPYPESSYSGGERYRQGMASETEHRELADALLAATSAVVLSGYDCPLYDELYSDWDRVEISALTNRFGHSAGARTEILWSNREISTPALF